MKFLLKICLAFIIASIVTGITSSDTVDLKFLKGVNRLNFSNHFDYYFSCSVVGRFLQWQYNEEPLNAFHSDSDVGESVVIPRVNYVYISTLLSSEPVENNNLAMDSLLIVFFISETTPSNFTITCTIGPHSKRESAGSEVSMARKSAISRDGSSIVLDYITSDTIVKNGTTHIFMCGAQHSLQLLQANGPPISFSSSDQVGFHRASTTTSYAVKEQGIFIASSPFMTTSILIVANELDVHVSCKSGQHLARVQTESKVPKGITPTPEVDQSTIDRGEATMDIRTDASQNMSTSSNDRSVNSNTVLIYGAIGTTLIIFIWHFTGDCHKQI